MNFLRTVVICDKIAERTNFTRGPEIENEPYTQSYIQPNGLFIIEVVLKDGVLFIHMNDRKTIIYESDIENEVFEKAQRFFFKDRNIFVRKFMKYHPNTLFFDRKNAKIKIY